MLQTIWHHSSVQFSLLFQMVYSVLLSVLHFKTILLVDPDWLLVNFHQSAVGVFKGNTASKMEHSIWKSNENWTEKWCQNVCSVLFDLFLCMTSSVLSQRLQEPRKWGLKFLGSIFLILGNQHCWMLQLKSRPMVSCNSLILFKTISTIIFTTDILN